MPLLPVTPRSAGHAIQWQQVPVPTSDLAGLPDGTKAFVSAQSKCTVFVSRTPAFGWHLSVAHPWRRPSWDEIASARYALVPNEVCMAMMLPPEAEYVNVHDDCFHLHECRCEREVAR